MLGRKLIMLQNGQISRREEIIFKTPYLEEWKHSTVKNIKKHGYTGLVAAIRFYVRGTNLLKNKYQKIKIKVKNIHHQNSNNDSPEKREISKFLKIISDYKHKIREIKHKIKEEEENS
ncbi:MAG: hypothetical protein AAB661_01880 [Patescibacteria group bacterium]